MPRVAQPKLSIVPSDQSYRALAGPSAERAGLHRALCGSFRAPTGSSDELAQLLHQLK